MVRARVGGWFGRCLAGVAVVGLSTTVSAQVVYRCRSADGTVAFQDRACAASQVQSEVAIDPAPASAPPPAHARDERPPHVARAPRASRRPAHVRAAGIDRSWQCRGADGSVFYRHAACPKSIPARAGAKAKNVGITAVPVARSDACRELRRAGAIGRAGHEHDEAVSTYEHNAGRDPCRYH